MILILISDLLLSFFQPRSGRDQLRKATCRNPWGSWSWSWSWSRTCCSFFSSASYPKPPVYGALRLVILIVISDLLFSLSFHPKSGWDQLRKATCRKPRCSLSIEAYQGRIQDFHLRGAQKITCANAHYDREIRSPFRQGSRACLRALEALGVFNAL